MTEPFDWSVFDGVKVRFWTCLVEHPRLPKRVTVEWDGDVATCTDCGRTNKEPFRPGDRLTYTSVTTYELVTFTRGDDGQWWSRNEGHDMPADDAYVLTQLYDAHNDPYTDLLFVPVSAEAAAGVPLSDASLAATPTDRTDANTVAESAGPQTSARHGPSMT